MWLLDNAEITVLETKDDIALYFRTVLSLKPKFLAFDYKITGPSLLSDQRLLVGSMCWQNNLAVSWEWANTPEEQFVEILGNEAIGKIVTDRNFLRRWVRSSFGARIKGTIWEIEKEVFISPNEIRNKSIRHILDAAGTSILMKYKIGVQEILTSGILNK